MGAYSRGGQNRQSGAARLPGWPTFPTSVTCVHGYAPCFFPGSDFASRLRHCLFIALGNPDLANPLSARDEQTEAEETQGEVPEKSPNATWVVMQFAQRTQSVKY